MFKGKLVLWTLTGKALKEELLRSCCQGQFHKTLCVVHTSSQEVRPNEVSLDSGMMGQTEALLLSEEGYGERDMRLCFPITTIAVQKSQKEPSHLMSDSFEAMIKRS